MGRNKTDLKIPPSFIPIYIQKDAMLHSLFYLEIALHVSGGNITSGALTTVSTASGICHTVTVICCYRGRVGTGLSVLWVAVVRHPQHTQISSNSSTIATDNSNGMTNTRCCRYSC